MWYRTLQVYFKFNYRAKRWGENNKFNERKVLFYNYYEAEGINDCQQQQQQKG